MVVAGAEGEGKGKLLVKGHKVALSRMSKFWRSNIQHGNYN